MVIYLNPFIMPIVFRFNNISFHFHSSFAAFLSLLLQNAPLCFHYEISSQFRNEKNLFTETAWFFVFVSKEEMPLGNQVRVSF